MVPVISARWQGSAHRGERRPAGDPRFKKHLVILPRQPRRGPNICDAPWRSRRTKPRPDQTAPA
ncbi:MAG: hypothetical protein ACK55I_00935, partial [bacterium]